MESEFFLKWKVILRARSNSGALRPRAPSGPSPAARPRPRSCDDQRSCFFSIVSSFFSLPSSLLPSSLSSSFWIDTFQNRRNCKVYFPKSDVMFKPTIHFGHQGKSNQPWSRFFRFWKVGGYLRIRYEYRASTPIRTKIGYCKLDFNCFSVIGSLISRGTIFTCENSSRLVEKSRGKKDLSKNR